MTGRVLAVGLLFLAGCATTPEASERLALAELLGIRFDAPDGGTLPTDSLGISGASFVTDWVEPADNPRIKARAYLFPGEGVFDSKEDWTVEEWVNRETRVVEVMAARLELLQGNLRKSPGTETVLKTGLGIRDYFDFVLGAPDSERYRDTTGRVVSDRPEGPFEQNYLWVAGHQAVRLGLFFADGEAVEEADGRVTIEVQRLDALSPEVRTRVLTEWGVGQDLE